jgi:hypothetical protein
MKNKGFPLVCSSFLRLFRGMCTLNLAKLALPSVDTLPNTMDAAYIIRNSVARVTALREAAAAHGELQAANMAVKKPAGLLGRMPIY